MGRDRITRLAAFGRMGKYGKPAVQSRRSSQGSARVWTLCRQSNQRDSADIAEWRTKRTTGNSLMVFVNVLVTGVYAFLSQTPYVRALLRARARLLKNSSWFSSF